MLSACVCVCVCAGACVCVCECVCVCGFVCMYGQNAQHDKMQCETEDIFEIHACWNCVYVACLCVCVCVCLGVC